MFDVEYFPRMQTTTAVFSYMYESTHAAKTMPLTDRDAGVPMFSSGIQLCRYSQEVGRLGRQIRLGSFLGLTCC